MFVLQARIGWLLATLGVLGSALGASAQEHTKDSLDAVKKALAANKAVLIDVREKNEWDLGHLKDAKILPLTSLKEDSLPKYLHEILPKDKIAYLHCAAGRRCLEAAEILGKHGYDVRPLKDGYKSLLTQGFLKAQAEAGKPETIKLWPGRAPGETKELPPEQDTSKPGQGLVAGKSVIRLGNVSTPTLAIYRPAKDRDTGAAIIVCPGGGHTILAYDLEGTEVADWLNKIGVTACVLKYRVPARDPKKRWIAAVQDAQRAVSLVRANSAEWGIDAKRIGILGFSAGGETAGLTALFDQRQYDAQDAMDKVSSRPDFAVLIYPGGFEEKDQAKLRDHVRVTKDAPPMFFAHAANDGVTALNSLLLAVELKKVGVPAELHLYATGGHGFGLRPQAEKPCTQWPSACEAWMRTMGITGNKTSRSATQGSPKLRAIQAGESSGKPRQKLYITNSAGNDVTVVDVATNKVIGSIEVGPKPHGIAVRAAQDSILVTIEGGKVGELVWIDPVTDKIMRRMPIGPAPNQLAVTPDGKFAYIPVSDGYYEVVDVPNTKIVERIFTGGRPHNTVCSASGERIYLAPMGNPKKVTIVDVAKHKVVGEIPFSSVVRPVAVTKDEKRFFAEVDGLVGIEMADVPARKMIHRVPAELTGEQKKVGSRSHGLGIRPDEKEVWECDVEHKEVHVYDITGERPKQIATIPMPGNVYWLTFDPAGRFCYVSVLSRNEVVVVDTAKKQIVASIPVGKAPKRLIVVTMALAK